MTDLRCLWRGLDLIDTMVRGVLQVYFTRTSVSVEIVALTRKIGVVASSALVVPFALAALCQITWSVQAVFMNKGHIWEQMYQHVALVCRTSLFIFWSVFMQHCSIRFVAIF